MIHQTKMHMLGIWLSKKGKTSTIHWLLVVSLTLMGLGIALAI